jgi:sugar phosphate isomerase/epimerase
MNFAQPILAAEGIRLGYHNHSHEFAVMPWGSTIHGELEKRTQVHFEIDTFWAFNAGCDPVAVMERLGSRIHVIHLKDGFMGGKGTPLGGGEAPVQAVVEYASKNGIAMVVESETLQPSGLAEAEICIEFLKKLG